MDAKDMVYAARMQFAVMKPANVAVLSGVADMDFKTQRTRPRSVADIRYKGRVGIQEVMEAHDRFYQKWGKPPDVIRVHPDARADLQAEADRLTKKVATAFEVLPKLIANESKHLTVYGIKVTL